MCFKLLSRLLYTSGCILIFPSCLAFLDFPSQSFFWLLKQIKCSWSRLLPSQPKKFHDLSAFSLHPSPCCLYLFLSSSFFLFLLSNPHISSSALALLFYRSVEDKFIEVYSFVSLQNSVNSSFRYNLIILKFHYDETLGLLFRIFASIRCNTDVWGTEKSKNNFFPSQTSALFPIAACLSIGVWGSWGVQRLLG